MIVSFKHKGLELFFTKGNSSKLNPKQTGTPKVISHKITGINLGKGYELDQNMQLVPIRTPLQTVVLSLVLSGPFEYMVETAYLEL